MIVRACAFLLLLRAHVIVDHKNFRVPGEFVKRFVNNSHRLFKSVIIFSTSHKAVEACYCPFHCLFIQLWPAKVFVFFETNLNLFVYAL